MNKKHYKLFSLSTNSAWSAIVKELLSKVKVQIAEYRPSVNPITDICPSKKNQLMLKYLMVYYFGLDHPNVII
jgi:hypothetical protein